MSFFVMVGTIVIRCISQNCVIVDETMLQGFMIAGTVELFLEVRGMLKIFKDKG